LTAGVILGASLAEGRAAAGMTVHCGVILIQRDFASVADFKTVFAGGAR